MKNCSRASAFRKCSFGSPARFPYLACFGQVSTVMSSGTLKPKMKSLGRRVEQLRPVLLARELVERQVAADRRERLGIFGQAVFLELGFGELAPGDVSIP